MATLKINELSVGDWVYYGNETTPYSIRSIYRTGIQDCVVLNDEKFSDGVIAFVDRLTPIPITAEILEKNGFVKNGEYNEWNIGTWRTPHLLGVSLERPAITIKWNGSSIFIDQAKYIHQLQHALRLAGVDKEINL